jgi:hypothetical protein
MKAVPLAAFAIILSSCASANRPQAGPGAERLGVPAHEGDPGVAGGAPAAPSCAADPGAIQLPDRITIPASYRLMLVDGHLALVRETDAQSLDPGPAALRIVTGGMAQGELAYQPGLLPQELAAEVASSRASAARMDSALDTVMARSRELSQQAVALEAQAKKLAELIADANARPQEPRPPGGSDPAGVVPPGPDTDASQKSPPSP